jgi:glucokinase
MVRNYIVADVGGTHIRVACFPIDSQKPSCVKKILTKGPDAPHLRLIKLIESIFPDGEEVAAITVTAPGPCDPYEGIVYNAPNVPGWVDLPLKKLVQEHFNVPVAIGNDANLAALGEWRFGAGIGHHYLIYITVSTGIGAGVILNDQLLLGVHGLAAELGHITVMPDGPLCSCGKRGHLEAVTSGTAIARWVEQQLIQGVSSSLSSIKPITAKDVSQAASQGDKLALEALTRAGTCLGIAIVDFLHIFNPSLVIIGGGVSRSGEPFFGPMRKSMSEHALSRKYLDDVTITTSVLGDEVGLMGGLALAQSLNANSPCQ